MQIVGLNSLLLFALRPDDLLHHLHRYLVLDFNRVQAIFARRISACAQLFVERPKRLDNGLLGSLRAQMFHAQQVIKQIGDGALEAIECAQGLLPECNEEIDGEVRPVQKARQFFSQGARTLVLWMILEILLELIEHYE